MQPISTSARALPMERMSLSSMLFCWKPKARGPKKPAPTAPPAIYRQRAFSLANGPLASAAPSGLWLLGANAAHGLGSTHNCERLVGVRRIRPDHVSHPRGTLDCEHRKSPLAVYEVFLLAMNQLDALALGSSVSVESAPRRS